MWTMDVDAISSENLELIKLNIRGRIFEIDKSSIVKHGGFKLNRLSESDVNYLADRQCWYFNRNPDVFESVVDYLVTGYLHVPKSLCLRAVTMEMKFWELNIEKMMDSCCWLKLKKDADMRDNLERIHDKWRLQRKEIQDVMTYRKKTWRLLSDSTSSKGALVRGTH